MARQSSSNTIACYLWIIGFGVLVSWVLLSPSTRQGVVLNTLALGLASSVLALVVGVVIWVAGISDSWMGRLLLLATVVTAAMPPWVQVCAWDAAFGRLGWMTALLTDRYSAVVPPWPAAIWIHAMMAAPQVALVLHLYQACFDWSQEESASLDRGPCDVFFSVTLPRLIPALLVGGIWTLIVSNREIAVTDIYQIGTLAEQIYLGYSLGLGGVGYGMVPAELSGSDVPLFLGCMVWMVGGALVAARQTGKALAHRTTTAGRDRRALTPGSPILKAGVILLFTVPLSNLIVRAGMRTVAVAGVARQQWSLDNIFVAMTSAIRDNYPEWEWSLAISCVGATAITLFALMSAGVARRFWWAAAIFWVSVLVVGVVPGPVIGRMLAQLSGWSWSDGWNWLWDRTIFGPVLASGIFLWPLAAVSAWCLFRSIPENYFDVAKNCGKGPVSTWIFVVFQTGWKTVMGLWMLMAALYFGELSASHLVRPGGIDIIPRLALGKMHSGIDEVTASIGLVSSLALATVAVVGWMLVTSQFRKFLNNHE